VVFTASHQSYADVVLDTLEEEFLKQKYLTKEEQELLDSHDSLKQKSMLLA
tara:strand:+ start:832 stop:984 length:153 start_codon:yes stop_codon:yes gene_type:complete